MSSDRVFRGKGGDGEHSGWNLSASVERRGEKGEGEGGNVGAEGWKRTSREEKDPVQKRRDEIRIPSALRWNGGFKRKQS
jgi:hypothetical protein